MIARAIPMREMLQFAGDKGSSRDAALRRLQTVADLLDSAFIIPGTRQRIGIDAIVGIVPGIGDILTTLLSSYIICEARNLGVSKFALTRMLANLGIHAVFGSVPLIGDAFDAFFRVNQRNMRILRSQLDAAKPRA